VDKNKEKKLLKIIQSLDYGRVQISIQNSKIIVIKVTESFKI